VVSPGSKSIACNKGILGNVGEPACSLKDESIDGRAQAEEIEIVCRQSDASKYR